MIGGVLLFVLGSVLSHSPVMALHPVFGLMWGLYSLSSRMDLRDNCGTVYAGSSQCSDISGSMLAMDQLGSYILVMVGLGVGCFILILLIDGPAGSSPLQRLWNHFESRHILKDKGPEPNHEEDEDVARERKDIDSPEVCGCFLL